MARLLTAPEQYDGEWIKVSGTLVIEHERTALYVHPHDATYSLDENAVWIEFADSVFLGPKQWSQGIAATDDQLLALDRRVVVLGGVVDSKYDVFNFQVALKEVNLIMVRTER